MNLEKSYYNSNNPRSVHAAVVEYMKMHDAITLFSTSLLERENNILRSQAMSTEELRAEFNAKIAALKRGFETQELPKLHKKLLPLREKDHIL